MIEVLKIKNFVLLEDVTINFFAKSNGIVGETGVGKSVIFSAISVLSGQRNLKKFIMKNKDYYELEMDINLERINNNKLEIINGILKSKITANDKLNIYRKLDISGKSVIKINNENYTVFELKNICEQVIDQHEQDSTNLVLNEDNHIKIIDKLIDKDLLLKFNNLFLEYSNLKKKIKELHFKNNNKEESLEYIELKLKHLSKIEDYETEDELEKIKIELEQEEKIRSINKVIGDGLDLIIDKAKEVSMNSNKIKDESFINDVEKIITLSEELSYNHTRNIMSAKEYNIDEVNEKLNTIKTLKRKYRLDYEGLITKKNDLVKEKEELNNISFTIIKEEKIQKEIRKELDKLCVKISKKRKEKIKNVQEKFNKYLKDLKMENAQLEIRQEQIDLCDNGIDEIKFYIRTNKGHDFGLIDKIASGGEKSRIMLLLKIVLNKFDNKLVYILDEVDQGVSTKIAKRMGEKINDFANDSQLILISHTVQVINTLDNLFEVEKFENNEFTKSKIRHLNNKERIEFIKKYLEI